MQLLRASPVFALAVLLTLGIAGLIGLMVLLMQLQPGFMGMAHFTDPHHRTHELTFVFLFGVAVAGLLAQPRHPSENVAGMVMALIPWIGLLLAGVLSTDVFRVMVINPSGKVGAVMVITALLHPTGRDFFRSFSISRINRVLLALVVVAAVPLLAFGSSNVGLQGTVPDDHAVMGQYGFMAAFSFTVIGVGPLASLRPDGWWLPAWVAGILPALLGRTSMVYPDNSSSLDLVWALSAVAWGVVFVAAAELTQDAASPTLRGSRGIIPTLRGSRGETAEHATRVRPDRGPTTRTPLWVRVLRVIALVPILLVFINTIMTITGVSGAGGHGPGLHTGGGDTSPAGVTEQSRGEIEAVKQQYGGYTVAQAEQEGYVRDPFCLDAAGFDQPAARGAMGFHATNEALLRGPIAAERPQALMFDAEGRLLGLQRLVAKQHAATRARSYDGILPVLRLA